MFITGLLWVMRIHLEKYIFYTQGQIGSKQLKYKIQITIVIGNL